MVGYDPSNDNSQPWGVYTLSGAASGFLTRGVTQPLDVIKIRFQIQDDPLKGNGTFKYRGMCQAACKIFNEEGVCALWKGHVPAQFLSISYGAFQFGLFEILTKMTHTSPTTSTSMQPLNHFVCGSTAGIASTFLSYPFDVVRTRLIIQGHPKVYNSTYDAFRTIVVKETAVGLYKGFVPTAVQIAPNIGLQFAFYHLTSSAWNLVKQEVDPNSSPAKPPGIFESLVCGSLAGLGAKTVTYPLDFAKKRLQMKGFHSYGSSVIGRPQDYKGLMDCLVTVVRGEGFFALYKGLAPSMVKAVSTSALIFCSYEQFLSLFSTAHKTFKES